MVTLVLVCTWATVLHTTITFLWQRISPQPSVSRQGSHTCTLVASGWVAGGAILTTSPGCWHRMVSWLMAWVLRSSWQYSACCPHSSVTFTTRTTSTSLAATPVSRASNEGSQRFDFTIMCRVDAKQAL